MCFIYNVALQKTHCYWAISGFSISPLYLSYSIKFPGFWDIFSAKSFPFCIVIPHQSISRPSGKRRRARAFLGSGGYRCPPRAGQSPTEAECGSNVYATAASYRKSGCGNPARVAFEPWFICGTLFLFLNHHYVHFFLAWTMYLMCYF